jgi:hypothetical protein
MKKRAYLHGIEILEKRGKNLGKEAQRDAIRAKNKASITQKYAFIKKERTHL